MGRNTSKSQAANQGPRIAREKETVTYMIALYCRKMHKERQLDMNIRLCEECSKLYRYANQRLTICRFGEEKTTCVDCPIHCYGPEQREQIKAVMRYAGPRMLVFHPILAIRHIIDGRSHKREGQRKS